MRLLLIRHGESEADLLGVHEGRADFSLTERGYRQAQAMASHVAEEYCLSAIYCSPLQRASQTAACLSEATGIPVWLDERLMEFDNGLLAGMDRQEAFQKYPPVKDVPLHSSVYGQESKLAFRLRAEEMLSRILSETADDATIAIVSHGGTINQLYRSFLRQPVDSDVVFPTGDTGIHEWNLRDGMRVIVRANATEHISGI